MAKHTKPKTGLWVTSHVGDCYPGDAYYDTREEAIACAPEDHCHVGKIHVMSDDEIAGAFVRDWDEADEHLGIQDEWWGCEDELIYEPTAEALDELQAFVLKWVRKHDLNLRRWNVSGERFREAKVESTDELWFPL